MKYLVVSDIHGSGYYIDKFIEIEKNEHPDKIILLGDLYYHGPRNPLTKEYNPLYVSQVLNNYKDKIICIRGNCDALVDESISSFEFLDEYNLVINNKKIYFTHGHIFNYDNPKDNIDILIYGHFHVASVKKKNGITYVNTGSISLPKENSQNSYLVIDDEKIIIKDIEGNKIEEVSL